jgi:hypothetical protein
MGMVFKNIEYSFENLSGTSVAKNIGRGPPGKYDLLFCRGRTRGPCLPHSLVCISYKTYEIDD